MLIKKEDSIFKKGITFLVILSIAASAFSFAALAASDQKSEEPLIITAFKAPETTIYTVKKENLAELTASFPEYLDAVLENETRERVPVDWVCDDDYQATEYDLYTFHAVYNSQKYVLNHGLTDWDIPCIDVHIQSEGSSDVPTRMVYPANPEGTKTIDQYLGASNLLTWLNSHEKDKYYIGTPYRGVSGSWDDPRTCMQPNGNVQSNYTAGMNCTGFVAHAFEKGGGNLNRVTTRLSGAYANAYNWSDTVYNNDLKSYRFNTISEALKSGVLKKGDVIHFEPANGYSGTDNYGNTIDCHIGFFWGNSPTDNKFWHSYHSGNGIDGNSSLYSGNQISQLVPKSYPYYIYIFPIQHSGYADLKKSSAESTIVSENKNYSLSGAQYGVFRDKNCSDKITVLTTTSDGTSNKAELPEGTYYVKETAAPPGYQLDPSVYTCTVISGKTTTINVKDTPYLASIPLLLKKIDADTEEGNPALANALFQVNFYTELLPTDASIDLVKTLTPVKQWILRTDEEGHLLADTKHKVSGDDFWTTSDGNVVFPYGTITYEEIEAPDGYRINPTLMIAPVIQDQVSLKPIYQAPIQKEFPVRLKVLKLQSDTDKPIKDAVFEHTRPDGSKEQYITDEQGTFSISGLNCGKHSIVEISAPDGYMINTNPITFLVEEDRTVTVTPQAEETDTDGTIIITVEKDGNLSAVVEDRPAPFQLHIHKINNHNLALKDAEFALYGDAECTGLVAKSVTDANGNLKFDQLIPETIYYLQETKAPPGYALPLNEEGRIKTWKLQVKSIPIDDVFECYIDDQLYEETSGDFHISGTKTEPVVNMTIYNKVNAKLPKTGSAGMLFFIGAGSLLFTGSMIFSRKNKQI